MIFRIPICYGIAKGEQMLEYLRNAAEKPVAKILIGILAFSFVGWGVAEWIFGGAVRSNTLVSVGGESISVDEFNMEKTRQLASMTREQQKQVYTDAAAANQFYGTVMGTLTTNKMVENRADDLGFVITDRRVAREIRDFPEFQLNGQFSTIMFDAVLNRSGFSEASFANYLRRQIGRSMVLGAMSVPVPIPEFAVRAAYNARYSQRKINYATVKFSDIKVGTPTDADLREFYATNPHTIAETRRVSYILIPADMSKPDKYDAAYAIATRVEDDIIGGMAFADIPTKHKGAKYVSIAKLSSDNRPNDPVMTDAMVARAMGMDAEIESEMIETKSGFVIMRVDEIRAAHNAEFDSVKKDLVVDWRRAQQRKAAYVRANELLVDLNQNGKLAGCKTVTVSRASGAPVAVLAAVFKDAVGTNTLVDGTDAFYVLHVDADVPAVENDKQMAAMRTELENMMTRNIMDDYNAFLGRKYPVKVNDKMFQRLFQK